MRAKTKLVIQQLSSQIAENQTEVERILSTFLKGIPKNPHSPFDHHHEDTVRYLSRIRDSMNEGQTTTNLSEIDFIKIKTMSSHPTCRMDAQRILSTFLNLNNKDTSQEGEITNVFRRIGAIRDDLQTHHSKGRNGSSWKDAIEPQEIQPSEESTQEPQKTRRKRYPTRNTTTLVPNDDPLHDDELYDDELYDDETQSDSLPKLETKWRNRYQELVQYFNEHGHSNVPKGYALNPNLSVWVMNQRLRKKSGKLLTERIIALEELNFEWSRLLHQSDNCEDAWQIRYQELQQFYNQHGHSNVPNRHPSNKSLGLWVKRQRQLYRSQTMVSTRVTALEQLDFEWVCSRSSPRRKNERLWQERYSELQTFYQENGHCNVAFSYQRNKKLGPWVSQQRKKKKQKMLLPNQISALEQIDFQWSLRKTKAVIL